MIDINGRLHSTEKNVNVIAGADEILDDTKNKKQSDINTETYALVNEINAKLATLSPEQQSALSVATKANKNEANLGYYICGIAENVAAKVISDATGYILSKGGSMKVKMTNANTANNATLNINSTGPKPLYYNGERASANNSWEAGETVEVYYDGTNYYANNVAGGSGDGVFNISAKTGNTYETLSAALTAANSILSAGKKKGGMSIKFIQSSDNKYVQFRYMETDTSTVATFTNTDNWAVESDVILTESTEYFRCITDKNNQLLWAIRTDGTIYWGAGLPHQVKDYVEKRIRDLSINEVLDFLGGLIDDETLQDLLDEKVDKVEGKGLSTNDFDDDEKEVVDMHSLIEDTEYMKVEVDQDGKILGGRLLNGTRIENMPMKTQTSETYSTENSEFMKAIVDKDGKLLASLNKKGKVNLPYPTNQDDILDKNIKEVKNRVYSNLSSIVSSTEYNLVREDRCNNGIAYLFYLESINPFANMKIIKNGKIEQDVTGRNYITRLAVFGDTHFGYTLDGSKVLDPTTEDRCGMAFNYSNSNDVDFSIILGDILQGGTPSQIRESYAIYYNKQKMLKSPCFPIEGNHDERIQVIEHDEFIKTGVIQFRNVRMICFNAIYAGATTDIGKHNGDVTDEVYAWLAEAVEESYNSGYITILACHYGLYYDANDTVWKQSLRNHRQDIIQLCYDYDVRLYINGHTHATGLVHEIVSGGGLTLDMTDVVFGRCYETYSTLEISDSGFNITERDSMSDEVLHTLYIPLKNQSSGTIYN